MPIVTHSLDSHTQADGSANNTPKMYDQDGREYLINFYTPANFDIATLVANRIADTNEQLALGEYYAIVNGG